VPTPTIMKEFTVEQIADALAGDPAGAEMRLLLLFQSKADPQAEVKPVPIRAPLAKAA